MKHVIATSLMSLVLSTSAFAMGDLDIEIRDQDAAYLAALPQLKNVEVSTKPAPLFATVQPTVYLSFDHYSCGKRSFVVELKETSSVYFVAVKDTNDIDCMAIGKKHSYKLQIASDSIEKPVIVLNPSVYRQEPEVGGPRICTQDAGMLFNPKTGKCMGFTNGCQKRDLMNQGYDVHVQGNECNQ